MMSDKRVIEANVVIKKRSNADPSSARPATITVTPGSIEIVSIGARFPPIRIKTDSLVKFKRPQGKSVNWASLNFIQNIDAKLSYVNIQVDLAKMSELAEVLEFAWKPAVVDVFADDADQISVPVHSAAPNATKSTRPATGRNTERRVRVDEEGSAAHPYFSNDFVAKAKVQKTDLLKASFVEDKKEIDAKPVHKLPPGRSNRLPASLSASTSSVTSKPKTTSTLSSLLRDGEEVVKKQHEERKAMPPPSKPGASTGMASNPRDPFDEKRSEGIGETSFYGKEKQKTTMKSTIGPSKISSVKRMSTKDSLDAERGIGRMTSRVTMTPGIRPLSAIEECERATEEKEADENDLPSSSQPTIRMGNGERRNEKSLTDPAFAHKFDNLFGKKSSNSSLPSRNNPPYRPPIQNSQFRSTTSSIDTLITPVFPWIFKAQDNIGNSCYMNSTMQILAGCPIFVRQLIDAVESLREKKGVEGISSTLRILYSLMRWLTGCKEEKKPVAKTLLWKMRDQLKTLDAIFEEGGGMAQQDAEECLTAVLGAISDECTGKGFRKRDSLSRRSIGGGGVSPVKRVDTESGCSQVESGEGDTKKEKEYPAGLDPVDLMEVKMKDVKKCNWCGDTNEKEAVEHRVHLGVEEERRDRPWAVKCVQQLLAAEVANQETIDDFKCEKCGQKCDATGTKLFVAFGEYIIIVLKRFGYDENHRLRKLNTPIRVPLYLEVADLTNGEKTQMHDETIVLHEEKGQRSMKKSRNEIVKTPTPLATVMDKTKEWLEEKEEDEEDLKTEVTQTGAGDAVDPFFDDDGGGDIEEVAEGGWVKDDEKKTDEEDQKTAVNVITIESSQSDGEENGEKRSGMGDGEKPPSPPSRTPVATPPTRTTRMETPLTVQAETMRRSDGERRAAPTPSRKRDRLSIGSERRKENRFSSGSRSSLSLSEPSKPEKISRLEGRRRSKEDTSPVSSRWRDDEVKMVDEEDEGQRARRLSTENKPCWKIIEPTKEKRKSDEYEFNDEEEKNEKPPGSLEKKNRTLKSFTSPTRPKRPLTHQNGTPTHSPMKGDDRRKRLKGGENVDPSPVKMEQTGGGKRKNETDEIVQKSDEEGKEMDANGDGRKNELEGRMEHVTRRSRAREMKMMKEEEEEKKEEEEGRVNEEKEEMEEVREEDEGNIMSRGDKDDEEETSDEVVQETPPEEMEEEGRDGKEEEEEAGKEEDDEEKEDEGKDEKEEEDEDGEGRLIIDEGEESEKTEEAAATDDEFRLGEDEARVFDTPKNIPSCGDLAEDRGMDGMESNEDGEVRVPPVLSPNCSPVKKEEKEEEEEREAKEETPEIVDVKEVKKYARNEYRSEWRQLMIDTDAAPLRGHFFFRPVDDRWMKGQCRLLRLDFHGHDLIKRIRSQSSLCKISTEPDSQYIVEIDGDGNCLFRSISWWVTGSQEAHEEMRRKIVEFMCYFPDEFGSRMGGDGGPPKKYTMDENNRMLELGEWGTHCEIYGAATLLGVDIYTYHEKRWKTYRPIFDWSKEGDEYQVTRKTEVNERTRFGLYLSNPENMHYDIVTYMEPVVPMSETSYRLLGTILHRGSSACSGHYVADVFDREKNQWLHCDDEKIKKRTIIEVLENATEEGYVLVYGKSDSVVTVL